MKQYLDLLREIKDKGTHKPPAREGMPGSLSLFGYQFRHNLADGFPALTTKRLFWKGVVTELLWFLRGDTNIKYLVDNGVHIWDEDSFQYYMRKAGIGGTELSRQGFVKRIEDGDLDVNWPDSNYKLGDCGYQYGKVWRDWEAKEAFEYEGQYLARDVNIDQIKNVINSLKNTPESRRHIVTAIDPAHDNDLALYWCHALFQFNCRPLTANEKALYLIQKYNLQPWESIQVPEGNHIEHSDSMNNIYRIMQKDFDEAPKYYLDCHLYQRSADVVLGVPFNIASYALLTHIIAKICNMIPGDYIHSFGDVHIYDNHMEAVEEQLSREPRALPSLKISEEVNWSRDLDHIISFGLNLLSANELANDIFKLDNYNPHPSIQAKLSTGLIK